MTTVSRETPKATVLEKILNLSDFRLNPHASAKNSHEPTEPKQSLTQYTARKLLLDKKILCHGTSCPTSSELSQGNRILIKMAFNMYNIFANSPCKITSR